MTSKQKLLMSLAIVVIFATLLLIIFGDNGVADLNQLITRHDALVLENEKLARDNMRLYRQIERLKHDPVYIESVARQELGMIGKDEIILKPRKDNSPK